MGIQRPNQHPDTGTNCGPVIIDYLYSTATPVGPSYSITKDDIDFFYGGGVTRSNGGEDLTLNEAKDECKKNFEEKKIAHMIIKNYIIDNNEYSSLPINKICNNFSLDIKFICIPINLIKKFEETLKRYQISINRIVSAGYVLSFFSQNEHNIIRNSKDIINGCNENEVRFTNKAHKNIGFFEKFFKLFG